MDQKPEGKGPDQKRVRKWKIWARNGPNCTKNEPNIGQTCTKNLSLEQKYAI